MSFVLEALKKQEAGRDPDAAVSLSLAGHQRRRHRLWIGLFAMAMAVNVAMLIWFFVLPPAGGPAKSVRQEAQSVRQEAKSVRQEAQAPASAEQHAETASTPSGATGGAINATEDAQSTSMPAQPVATPPAGPAARREPGIAEPASVPEPTPITRLPLSNLPRDARARFPGIAFSTHVYAEDADLRAVVANGQRRQEGERIRGLEVVEITETGVVLAFEGYHVEVPIFTDWDAP